MRKLDQAGCRLQVVVMQLNLYHCQIPTALVTHQSSWQTIELPLTTTSTTNHQ